MKSTLLSKIAIVFAVLLLTGCSASERRDLGLAAGGVLGGVAGNYLTNGSTAGTIAGAVGGAFVGRELAN